MCLDWKVKSLGLRITPAKMAIRKWLKKVPIGPRKTQNAYFFAAHYAFADFYQWLVRL